MKYALTTRYISFNLFEQYRNIKKSMNFLYIAVEICHLPIYNIDKKIQFQLY